MAKPPNDLPMRNDALWTLAATIGLDITLLGCKVDPPISHDPFAETTSNKSKNRSTSTGRIPKQPSRCKIPGKENKGKHADPLPCR